MCLLSGTQQKSASWFTASVLTFIQNVGLDQSRALNQKSRELLGNNEESPVPRTLGWLHLLMQECSGWGVSPPAASAKDNCLWEEIPVWESQVNLSLSKKSILNRTLPNIHSNYCKDLSSAESDKWTDRNTWRNLLCLISDSEIDMDSNIHYHYCHPFPFPGLKFCLILRQHDRYK